MALLIPQASNEGHQRRNLTQATTYAEALQVIYETVGCEDVYRKPHLAYKLSTATLKSDPINLGSEEDWKGCLEDISQAQAKKKGNTVAVKIIIAEQVHLSSYLVHDAHSF